MTEPNWRKRAKLTGRGGARSFLSLPHWIMDSPQFAALTGKELRMFLELARQYRGANNGALSATREQLALRGWRNHQTIDAALAGLQRKGWILKTRQGGRRIGCTLYALAIWPVDDCGGKHEWPIERKPSHPWKEKSTGLILNKSWPDFQASKPLAA